MYKSRVQSTSAEAREALASGRVPADGPASREIACFIDRYPGLGPATLISYSRRAYHTESDGPILDGSTSGAGELRLTIDSDIRWSDRADGDVWLDSEAAHPLMGDGVSLMEAKTGGALPLWLVSFLSERRIYRRPFSKVGHAYAARLASSAPSPARRTEDPVPFREVTGND